MVGPGPARTVLYVHSSAGRYGADRQLSLLVSNLDPARYRALVVLPLSLVMFGLLMEYAGFVPALMVLIVGSAAAGSEFNLKEALLLAMGLTAFAVALFIYGLGLPYPLFAAW